MRLADPCRKHGSASATPGPWQPVGQERAFAASATLVLSTSVNASTRWQQQLSAIAGVRQVEKPYPPAILGARPWGRLSARARPCPIRRHPALHHPAPYIH